MVGDAVVLLLPPFPFPLVGANVDVGSNVIVGASVILLPPLPLPLPVSVEIDSEGKNYSSAFPKFPDVTMLES